MSRKDIIEPVTQNELQQLPRWACVAFAARCARRVQPLFKHAWPDAPWGEVDAVEAAIAFAEGAASSASVTADDGITYATLQANTRFAHAARAADAARDAARVAAAAANDPIGASFHSHNFASDAWRASDAAADAVVFDGTVDAAGFDDAFEHAYAEMRSDFVLLKFAAKSERWTDQTPVAPEFFGPLWREGPPEGWPEEQDEDETPHALMLEIAVPGGMNEVQSRDFNQKVKGLLVAMSALDASMGGAGLQILDDHSEEPIDAELEAPIDADQPTVGACA